jgi:hypothetical protein
LLRRQTGQTVCRLVGAPAAHAAADGVPVHRRTGRSTMDSLPRVRLMGGVPISPSFAAVRRKGL